MSAAKAKAWLYSAGAALTVSGVAHLVIWLIAGGSWDGDVSLRKPILFGLSTGATVLSMGWIYPKLVARNYDRIAVPWFSLAMVGEVALITSQYWRGVPSHFNRNTTLDASFETAMTVLILLASIFIIDLAVRSFSCVDARDDLLIAIRGGMAFLVVSIGIGVLISVVGYRQIENGVKPTTFGQSGVLKFPHGMAIHAIQFFPLFVGVAARLGIRPAARAKAVSFLNLAMLFALTFSLFQTFTGRARFEWNSVGSILLGVTVLAGTLAIVVSFRGRKANQGLMMKETRWPT